MMSLMVFTISAVNACRTHTHHRGAAVLVTCVTESEILADENHSVFLYLDLLSDRELFVLNVVRFNHQNVGGGQRLKLWTQVCF